METNESINEILNDLVKINNDRIAGYEKAISEAKELDIDLKAIFEGMISDSKKNKADLAAQIANNGGELEDETTSSGKIYRAWMDIKSALTDTDRHSILNFCEFGEDAAQRAYEAALSTDQPLSDETRKLIAEQQTSLKSAHELIKKERDAHEKVKNTI